MYKSQLAIARKPCVNCNRVPQMIIYRDGKPAERCQNCIVLFDCMKATPINCIACGFQFSYEDIRYNTVCKLCTLKNLYCLCESCKYGRLCRTCFNIEEAIPAKILPRKNGVIRGPNCPPVVKNQMKYMRKQCTYCKEIAKDDDTDNVQHSDDCDVMRQCDECLIPVFSNENHNRDRQCLSCRMDDIDGIHARLASLMMSSPNFGLNCQRVGELAQKQLMLANAILTYVKLVKPSCVSYNW